MVASAERPFGLERIHCWHLNDSRALSVLGWTGTSILAAAVLERRVRTLLSDSRLNTMIIGLREQDGWAGLGLAEFAAAAALARRA